LIKDEIAVQVVDTLKEKIAGTNTGNKAQGEVPGGHQGDEE
jgi:hypothetical protein